MSDMDKVRAEFEAWAVNQPWLEDDEGRVNLRYLGLHKQYVDMTVELASRAYAAGRNAKREPLSEFNIPRGWKAESVSPRAYLTDEANAERQWSVERAEPPHEGNDGQRAWFGPTLQAAFENAFQSLPKLRPVSAHGIGADHNTPKD